MQISLSDSNPDLPNMSPERRPLGQPSLQVTVHISLNNSRKKLGRRKCSEEVLIHNLCFGEISQWRSAMRNTVCRRKRRGIRTYVHLSVPQAGPLMGAETLLAGPSKKPFDPSGRPSDPSGKPSDPSGMPSDPSNRPLCHSCWLSDSFGQMDRRKDGWTDGCTYIQNGLFSIAVPSQL